MQVHVILGLILLAVMIGLGIQVVSPFWAPIGKSTPQDAGEDGLRINFAGAQDAVQEGEAGAGGEGGLGFAGVAVGEPRPARKGPDFGRDFCGNGQRELRPASSWRHWRAEPFGVCGEVRITIEHSGMLHPRRRFVTFSG